MGDPAVQRERIYALGVAPEDLGDPGDGGTIGAGGRSGYIEIVTAAAETRTLVDPLFIGQTLDLFFYTDGGDCVVTASSPVTPVGSTTFTFSESGEHIQLVAHRNATAGFVWRIVGLDIVSGLLPLVTKTGAYTLTSLDTVVLCDVSSAAFTVTLPAAADNEGRQYFIKKIDSSGNAVTVDGDGAETIDGETAQLLAAQYNAILVVSDGSAWHIL